MSNADRKNGWQLAEQLGERTPYKIQQFLYRGVWDVDMVRDDLRGYVSNRLGEADGVLIVDDTGFLKQGKKSAGVKRQYSGTAGRVENCQIGVFLTYCGTKGYTVLDRGLYLPKEWVEDKARCREAGIPEDVSFRTKPEMALEMIKAAYDANVPFTWVSGDCAYGDYRDIRMYLESIGKRYVMSVSGKESLWIGLRQYKVSRLLESLPEAGWERLSAGAGSKGEKMYDWFYADINSPEAGWKRRFLVRRNISNPEQLRAYICCCPSETQLPELVRIAGTRWTVEMCFAESKGEVGLDHYEVRSYSGWYRHITMAMCAHALLSVLKASEQDFSCTLQIPAVTSDSLWAFKKGRGLL
jgi:SRSO17 transposase